MPNQHLLGGGDVGQSPNGESSDNLHRLGDQALDFDSRPRPVRSHQNPGEKKNEMAGWLKTSVINIILMKKCENFVYHGFHKKCIIKNQILYSIKIKIFCKV